MRPLHVAPSEPCPSASARPSALLACRGYVRAYRGYVRAYRGYVRATWSCACESLPMRFLHSPQSVTIPFRTIHLIYVRKRPIPCSVPSSFSGFQAQLAAQQVCSASHTVMLFFHAALRSYRASYRKKTPSCELKASTGFPACLLCVLTSVSLLCVGPMCPLQSALRVCCLSRYACVRVLRLRAPMCTTCM